MDNDANDDYMGDLSQFLDPSEVAALQSSQTEKSSSLTTLHGKKLNWKEKQKIKKQERQRKEDERIKEGVNAAIPSDNIGFKLLKQMGYRPGAALGKREQGSLEPVGVEIKRNRTGIGRDVLVEEENRRRARELEMKFHLRKHKEQAMALEFEERKKLSWQNRRITTNYRKAYAVLAHLQGVDSIPNKLDEKEETQDSEKDAEEEHVVTPEDLHEVLCRLREEFTYCLFCGCQYESQEALHSNCPGIEEEDH
eukprot:TRINITY_DN1866_c0_g1_i1.p1 TRINITY_DN1866_c0_g1~~TRINITY_DN1866_c0_g1_i1.p1  ORF type:complete len:252 (+),score=59.82 TRINITY_DN1866_c0_g1_i1:169-924(+)